MIAAAVLLVLLYLLFDDDAFLMAIQVYVNGEEK